MHRMLSALSRSSNYLGQQVLTRFFSISEDGLKRKREPSEPSEPPLAPCSTESAVPQITFPVVQDYNLSSAPRPLSDDKYHPILDAPFKHDEAVPFRFLAAALELVENSKGKDSKTSHKVIMSNLFRSVLVLRKDQLVKCFYLCISKLCPEHLGVELGVGKETLFKCASRATGLSLKDVKREENRTGDLASVVAKGKATQKNLTSFFAKRADPAPITIAGVFEVLWKIATFHGQNSAGMKEDELIRLFNQATPEEVKFIVRIAQKALKVGASELTMQSALARAVAMTPPKQDGFPPEILRAPGFESRLEDIEATLKKAINQCPDYEKLISALLECKLDFSYLCEACKVCPGTPVKAMLAQPTKSIHTVLSRFANIEFTCEFKYDGMRAQIHVLPDQTIQIYSRNAENITEMYPDIQDVLSKHIDFSAVQNCILDSEVVAFDNVTQKIKSFQEIQHRGRKNVDLGAIEVKVCVFVFDILYLNGESLLDLSLAQRRQVLLNSVQEVPGLLSYAQFQNVSSFEDIESLVYESVKHGCEGLMVKTLHKNAVYEPAKRSLNWLKLKKDYLFSTESRLSDTVDLVPIGAYFGTGKRRGVYGSYLLAIYDTENDEYQTICKAGTGFSDEILVEFYNTLKEFSIEGPAKNYRVSFSDLDVWFSPAVVWEVLGADLSVSPKHTSSWCKVQEGKGISLRFPRFIRPRPDKKPENSTSPEQIAQMYLGQSTIDAEFF